MGVVNQPPAVLGALVAIKRATLPLEGREVGFSEQVAWLIALGTEQVRLTAPVKPLFSATLMAEAADWPGLAMLRLAGLAVRTKSGAGTDVTAEVEAA